MRFTSLLLIAVLCTSCINETQPGETEMVEFTVTRIQADGANLDIQFYGDEERFYINRGTERGLDAAVLDSSLRGKEVRVLLAKTIFGRSRHISQLTVKSDTIYTEFKSS